MGKPGLLILDGDDTARRQMRWAFSRDYDVLETAESAHAVRAARAGWAAVGIMDIGGAAGIVEAAEGMKAVREILSANPLFKAVVLSCLDGRELAMRAIDIGAFDFFTKPAAIEDVRLTVRRAVDTYRLQVESMGGQPGAVWPGEIIGLSLPMQRTFCAVRRLSEVNIPALVRGEPGSGKETLSRAIHRVSSRHSMPFIKVACDSMPETVLAAELFGTESEGGRRPSTKGKVELADGGTLYLEEVGMMSPSIQKRLYQRLFARCPDNPPWCAKAWPDTRVISSSTRDLRSQVRAGAFSEELYNRLSLTTLDVPPLRERGEDVYMLALYFLKKYSKELARPVLGFGPGAVEAISGYEWPGNVREMENRIRLAVSISGKRELAPEDLCLPTGGACAPAVTLAGTREAFRKRMIHEVLIRNSGNVTRTAAELGISRQYLSRLIARFNIKVTR